MTAPLTVLMAHNRYLERGGEDVVYEAECRLLQSAGLRVLRYERDNREVAAMSRPAAAARTIWNRAAARDIAMLVRRDAVDVVHFHNTFPLISPASHYAAKKAGAAVVQTLHNFRLLCPAGVFMRDGRPCELCLDRTVKWPAVVHRCYRNDAAASTVVSGMLAVHGVLRTWQTQVDAFIALSRFARDRFVAGGLPAGRIHINGGLVGAPVDDGVAAPVAGESGSRAFLFVGRLATEKGVDRLLDAWQLLPEPFHLRIIGAGPLEGRVRAAAAADPRITWLGERSPTQVMSAMREAWALVFPSQCYENYPAVLAEAQAAGLPVIASRLGSGAEIVDDGGFGILFDPEGAGALADAVQLMAADSQSRAAFSVRATAAWREHLTPERYLARLRHIYDCALARGGARDGVAPPSTLSYDQS